MTQRSDKKRGAARPTRDLADARPAQRWVRRPFLVRLVRIIAFLVPIAVGFAVGTGVGALVERGDGVLAVVAWWLAVVGAASLAAVAVDAWSRRLLPLSTLLGLTFAFPDHAPNRLRLAMRATNLRRLRDRVVSGADAGEPSAAAADVLALAAALNCHSRATRAHSSRVQAVAMLIAEELGVPEHEREQIGWGAFLHDIGKLKVPTAILAKPGRPDDDEWALLERHPEEGMCLVEPLSAWLGASIDAVGQHHEHHDGSGYPRGLTADEIGRSAAVVAVADTFETITSVRSYKRASTAEEARTEITGCAGTQFDPDVVRAFLAIGMGRLRRSVGLGWLGSMAVSPLLSSARELLGTVSLRVAGGLAGALALAAGLSGLLVAGGPGGSGGHEPAHARAHDRGHLVAEGASVLGTGSSSSHPAAPGSSPAGSLRHHGPAASAGGGASGAGGSGETGVSAQAGTLDASVGTNGISVDAVTPPDVAATVTLAGHDVTLSLADLGVI